MKILVCGGRDYWEEQKVFGVLDALHAEKPVSLLIYGMAQGADALAAKWAISRKVDRKGFPALWKEHGKGAGMLRNAQMLAEGPVLVVAFPGGRGTADMVRRARAAKVEVLEID